MAAVTKHALRAAGLPILHNPSHIVPVMVGDSDRCKAASDLLLNRHSIYIQPINYPTVSIGTERLRVTPTPRHNEAHVSSLVEALRRVEDSRAPLHDGADPPAAPSQAAARVCLSRDAQSSGIASVRAEILGSRCDGVFATAHKPRFSAANDNDILSDLRAIDRGIPNHHIEHRRAILQQTGARPTSLLCGRLQIGMEARQFAD
jgi:hypothetical protein